MLLEIFDGNVIQCSIEWRNDKCTVDILTHQKPDECNKITVQFSITQM